MSLRIFAPRQTGPIKAFIHIPKAAGSTVNAHLATWGAGIEHAQNDENTPARIARKLRRASWISGHLALNRMEALLEKTTMRPVEYFGLVRDPVKQVASHYNWLIEIRHRGERFFRGHGHGVRTFSDILAASDNNDPQVIIENIMRKPMLFLNLQSRFLMGDTLDLNKEDGFARLSRYACLTTRADKLARAMTGTELRPEMRENASRYHFDPTVFDSPEVREFLRRNHRHDTRLYAELSQAA